MKRILPIYLLALATACGDAPTAALLKPAAPLHDDVMYESCGNVICGPHYIAVDGEGTSFFTWSATTTAGTPPYSYAWTIHYDNWGSGPVGIDYYAVYFGVQGTDGHFNLDVTIRDATSTVVAYESHRVLVYSCSGFC